MCQHLFLPAQEAAGAQQVPPAASSGFSRLSRDPCSRGEQRKFQWLTQVVDRDEGAPESGDSRVGGAPRGS